MKILIIGSNGFIGSNAIQYFSRMGNEVSGADVYPSENNCPFYKIESASDYNFIFKMREFDVCINASGSATVGYSFANTFDDFVLNSVNVFHLLDAIKKNNPECKFIQLSSAAVYGAPDELPIRENTCPSPMSPYAYHKYLSEIICMEYFNIFNIPVCPVRIFSVYGPGLKKQLLWDIYQKSLKSDIIELSGKGTESRDFIFIEDLLQAFDCIIKSDDFKGQPVNIGSGNEITISSLANLFIDMISPGKKIIFNNHVRPGDPQQWKANISKLNHWGFSTKFSLKEGLSNYIKKM